MFESISDGGDEERCGGADLQPAAARTIGKMLLTAMAVIALAATAACARAPQTPGGAAPQPAESAQPYGGAAPSPGGGAQPPTPTPPGTAVPQSGSASPGPAATPPQQGAAAPMPAAESASAYLSAEARAELARKYAQAVPREWGERVTGVKRRLKTDEKVVALTFDAYGGPHGSGYDAKLIDYLVQENVPATLFINSRWLAANPDTFKALAANPLFEIENHGTAHRPLSVNGKSAYGIAGTRSPREVIDEALDNALLIEKLTGRRPKLFRTGTAYYDDVAVRIVEDLGMQAIGFDVLGDAGATFSAKQIEAALGKAKPGSIVIAHMNQPSKDTAAGMKLAIPELRQKGLRFVKLGDYELE
ncbi:polysaccharide deacetylase family protein [Gordoniibacillus kamchatkensis]|uniref:polysaccharide deacetylase family protein n=1 Tax=Gordoniibacillus kamchatkensis TaxID=1590651 RepID=UPI000695A5D9|nr:polysaccharide deacetylase family protein [Paenibacillus sp. VKM B-2647]